MPDKKDSKEKVDRVLKREVDTAEAGIGAGSDGQAAGRHAAVAGRRPGASDQSGLPVSAGTTRTQNAQSALGLQPAHAEQTTEAGLDSLDLMQLEPVLCRGLRRLFSFKGHSLHFPVIPQGETPPLSAEYLPREKKLLLPLLRNDSFLGMFVARGVESASVKGILPALVPAASICLDNLALYKAARRDSVTGLYSRESLLNSLAFELEQLRGSLRPALPETASVLTGEAQALAPFAAEGFMPASGTSPRFSLLVIRLNGLAAVVREHGYLRADQLLAALAAVLEENKPGQALAARSGDAEFSLLVPASGPQACRELGRNLVETLGAVRLASELTGRKMAVGISVGYVNCPRDLDGISRQSAAEQARILLRRARMAAAMAYENLRHSGQLGYPGKMGALKNKRLFAPGEELPLPVLSYGGILSEGGRVLQMTPLSRMTVSLGKTAGARPGQKFAVWGYVLESVPAASYGQSIQSGQSGQAGQPENGGQAGKAGQGALSVHGKSGQTGRKSQAGDTHRLSRRYKGEIVLIDVRQNDATAELVYCDDPYFPPETGDQLIMNRLDGAGYGAVSYSGTAGQAPGSGGKAGQSASEGAGYAGEPAKSGSGAYDPSTGFLNYSDFLPRWCLEREKSECSCLVLTRFGWSGQELPFSGPNDYDAEDGENVTAEDTPDRHWEELMRRCAVEFRKSFGESCLYGRYALNSFIAFVPNMGPEAVTRKAEELFRHLCGKVQNGKRQAKNTLGSNDAASGMAKSGNAVPGHVKTDGRLYAAFGVAPYPFLDFRKADGLENAQKALEYAALLPEPHVGVLDTLALNISADRRFSLGDQLGAISEYKKALLCDENNILAWNSLGVTLAGLGRHGEARRSFEEALKRDTNDFTALYNLGQLCQTLREHSEAERLYRRCLELDPQNVYTIHRLGQLAEQRDDNATAKTFYEQAQELPGGQILTRRSLARLAIKEGRLEDAREELHEALLINPNDAQALQLLAGLYLDAGEDPRVAESLARQSAALRPDLKAAWLELARALEAGGKLLESREALMKAGEL